MRPWLFLILGITILVSFIYRDKSDFEILLDKAEDGDSEAQYEVGWMYSTGQSELHGYESVAVDDAEALKWFRMAAEQDNSNAQHAIGAMCYKGEGVTKDFAEAEKWFQKAAEQDDANAQYLIGLMYYKGEGVGKDFAEAIKWFQKAAEQDNANAQYNIGVMYYHGESIPKDNDIAVEWFEKAADQGFAKAEEVLNVINKEAGVMPVPKDKFETLKWIRKVTERDYVNSQINLDAVKKQLESGLDVNWIDENGRTLLHNAVMIGNIDLVKLLVENGANFDTELPRQNPKHQGLTPIVYAVINNKKNIVSYLLEKGVDVDRKLNSETTILHHASAHNHIDLVKFIISKKADLNSQDEIGLRPLHYASNMGNTKIVKILIDAGANVNAIGNNVTPLGLAMNKTHTETADLLRKHGGKTGAELKAEGK